MASMYKSFYDIGKIVIWADGEGINNDSKRPRMTLSFRDGNPRIVVNTGEPGVVGMINFPMDPLTFGAVLETLRDIVTAEPGTRWTIDSLGSVWENDKPTDALRTVSVLHIGKTKDGIIYLCLIEETKPKIVFPLKSSKYHNFRDESKNLLPDSVISERLARGLIGTLSIIHANIIVDYTRDEYTYGNRKPYPLKGFENVTSKDKPKSEGKLTHLDSEMGAILEDLDI